MGRLRLQPPETESPPTRSRNRRWAVAATVLLSLGAIVFAAIRVRDHFQLAQAKNALIAGDYDNAVVALRRMETRDPRSPELHFLLGKALRRLGQIEESLEHLSLARRFGWSADEVKRQQIMARFQAGEIAANEQVLIEYLQQDQSDDDAEELCEVLTKGYLSTYRIGDALACLEHWIQWKPAAIQPYLWRAELREHERQWNAAIEDYEAVLKNHPDHYPALLRLAGALLTDNRVQDALGRYEQCYGQDPEDPQVWFGLAQCHRRLGNIDEAKALLEQTLAANLTSDQRGTAQIELGQLLLSTDKPDEAIAALRSAIEKLPQNAVAHHTLASALARKGESQPAKMHFAQAANIAKQHERLEELSRKLNESPGDAPSRYELALILRDLGSERESERWLLTALGVDPDFQPAHAALAEHYAKAGQMQLAAAHRRKAAGSASDASSLSGATDKAAVHASSSSN